jgi:hypothetical protein
MEIKICVCCLNSIFSNNSDKLKMYFTYLICIKLFHIMSIISDFCFSTVHSPLLIVVEQPGFLSKGTDDTLLLKFCDRYVKYPEADVL